MKNTMCLIVYNGEKADNVFRKDWELPRVSAEEFDPNIHAGKVFQHPEGSITLNSVYCWKYCSPENEEEEKLLISMGKWNSPYSAENYGKALKIFSHDSPQSL